MSAHLAARIGADGVARRGIGGSEAAAALGVHPYSAPIQAWLEITGRVPGPADNEGMEWGRRLEGPIRDRYARDHACTIYAPAQPAYAPDPCGWARGTPDGIVTDSNGRWVRGLEVKTAGINVAHQWGASGTDEVPIHYIVQCAWYMWIFDLPRWDIAVLVGGNDYRCYELTRDMDLERDMVAGVEAFWRDHVLADVEPPIDGSAQWSDELQRRYPRGGADYDTIVADEDFELVARYQAATRAAASAKAEKERIENLVCQRIGAARGLSWVGDDGRWQRVTWGARQGSPKYKLVAERFAAAAGVSSDEYTKTVDESRGAGSRVLSRPRGWTAK